MATCKHCSTIIDSKFCSNCGRPKELPRIDRKYLASEISSVINFDKGIFYTIKELIIRPGKTVREFILEDRKRIVKPILFLVFTSVFYTIIQYFFRFEDEYISYTVDGNNELIVTRIFLWMTENYGYSNILMAIFIVLWVNVFFRKYKYNFYEIFILLCFVMGITMLIYALFGAVESMINYPILQLGAFIGFIYCSWAIGIFFDSKKFVNYIKGLFSYLLGMISFIIAVLIIGFSLQILIT